MIRPPLRLPLANEYFFDDYHNIHNLNERNKCEWFKQFVFYATSKKPHCSSFTAGCQKRNSPVITINWKATMKPDRFKTNNLNFELTPYCKPYLFFYMSMICQYELCLLTHIDQDENSAFAVSNTQPKVICMKEVVVNFDWRFMSYLASSSLVIS